MIPDQCGPQPDPGWAAAFALAGIGLVYLGLTYLVNTETYTQRANTFRKWALWVFYCSLVPAIFRLIVMALIG